MEVKIENGKLFVEINLQSLMHPKTRNINSK